jgi:hypothetical protein
LYARDFVFVELARGLQLETIAAKLVHHALIAAREHIGLTRAFECRKPMVALKTRPGLRTKGSRGEGCLRQAHCQICTFDAAVMTHSVYRLVAHCHIHYATTFSLAHNNALG